MICGQAVKGRKKKKNTHCVQGQGGGVPHFLAHMVEVQVESGIQ